MRWFFMGIMMVMALPFATPAPADVADVRIGVKGATCAT
jgi:hypothetical protein